MKKVNIMFASAPFYSGNSKALYEYLKKNHDDKFDIYWLANNEIEKNEARNNKLNAVIYKDDKFYKIFSKIDIIFATHGQLIDDKIDSQIYVNLWHGIGPKKVGYILDKKNMTSFDDEFYFKLKIKTDYIIVPSNLWKHIFSIIFRTDIERILPIGYPKLDLLKKSNGKELIKENFKNNVYEYKKIIFYTPTFKMGIGRVDIDKVNDNIFNFKESNKKIINYLHDNNYLLCIKYHPSEEAVINKIKDDNILYIDTSIMNEKNLVTEDLLNASDILLTDYSSLGVDYTFLEKPVIFLINNINDYKNTRGIIFDDENFWMHNRVNNSKELLEKIDFLLTSKFDKSLKKLYFGDLKDGGCKNIYNYFFNNDGLIKENITHNFNYEYSLIQDLQKELYQTKIELSNANKNLELIYNSKSWKLLEKIRKIINLKSGGKR